MQRGQRHDRASAIQSVWAYLNHRWRSDREVTESAILYCAIDASGLLPETFISRQTAMKNNGARCGQARSEPVPTFGISPIGATIIDGFRV